MTTFWHFHTPNILNLQAVYDFLSSTCPRFTKICPLYTIHTHICSESNVVDVSVAKKERRSKNS